MNQDYSNIPKIVLIAFGLILSLAPAVNSQTSQQALVNGKELYTLNCANCHGDVGQGAIEAGFEISIISERGGKQPPNLVDSEWDHGSTDDQIFKVIKEGMPAQMMPPHEGRLSDTDIRNVIAYLRSLTNPSGNSESTAQGTPASTPEKKESNLQLEDYLELPITGDMSGDRVSGVLARGSILRQEPGSQRLFVNDLTGPLYIIDKETKELTTYIRFVEADGRPSLFPKFSAERGYAAGLLNFVFDPEYEKNGVFYTLHMEDPNMPGDNVMPRSGVIPTLNLEEYSVSEILPTPIISDANASREIVMVEWKDTNIKNLTFEGTAREVMRMKIPGLFHPFNEMIFNPTAQPGDPDWKVMYLGVGDSGTGERQGPMRMHAQRLNNFHGKILRIIPSLDEQVSTSTVSENGRYRIPNDNPFVSIAGARKEIWALGIRNPHRMAWYIDSARPKEPILLAFNIGLISWETVLIVKKGANYGYPHREGMQSMSLQNAMGAIPEDDKIPLEVSEGVTVCTMTPEYPVVAYPHAPGGGDAIANGFVYKGTNIPELKGALVFGDITTGRIWYTRIEDVLAADDGKPDTMAKIYELNTGIREKAEETFKRRSGLNTGIPGRGFVAGQGRVDLRLAEDSKGELYVISKSDGMIRIFKSLD